MNGAWMLANSIAFPGDMNVGKRRFFVWHQKKFMKRSHTGWKADIPAFAGQLC